MSRITQALVLVASAVLSTLLAGAAQRPHGEVVYSTSTSTVQTVTVTAIEPYVIWDEGPSTSRHGGITEHYVICVPASNPDGALVEYLVDEAEAYPVPDLLTDRHRFSAGEPCPYGRLRS